MLESTTVAILILASLAFLGRRFYRQFWGKRSGCSGCSDACNSSPSGWTV
ncbi:MAG: FeoB-associated Cys-rich membrane protein [Acidobacteria bacterium]|nr:FeoB-associated Cys-rich membrane protein [Acidobacteriota bacterium]MCB9399173.1 FeoB-associated Cys-rich membrane protein [Acidobacteriota bacterium]